MATGWAPWAGLYALFWAGAVVLLARAGGLESVMPALVIGAIFALVLPAVTVFLTRFSRPVAIDVPNPAAQMAGVAGWLLIYAVVCLGWLFTLIKQAVPPGTQDFKLVMMAVKLAIHVVIPLAILKALGGRVRPLFAWRGGQRGAVAVFLAVGACSVAVNLVLSPALRELSALHPALQTLAWTSPAAFLWVALEAGFCEEVLFRAILQSRLAAVLKSEAGAAVIGAVLFGLAHVPGLFLRPDAAGESLPGGLWGIVGYTVGVLSPIGLLYGVIWARTRNLWLLVALHATVDFLPNLPDFIHTWAG